MMPMSDGLERMPVALTYHVRIIEIFYFLIASSFLVSYTRVDSGSVGLFMCNVTL